MPGLDYLKFPADSVPVWIHTAPVLPVTEVKLDQSPVSHMLGTGREFDSDTNSDSDTLITTNIKPLQHRDCIIITTSVPMVTSRWEDWGRWTLKTSQTTVGTSPTEQNRTKPKEQSASEVQRTSLLLRVQIHRGR